MEVFVLFHILWSLPRGGTTHGGSRRSMLTKKQHELLLFIHRHLQKNGVSPSFDEMKDALALKSKSGIHRLITGLEERGFIRRLAHRARAVEVTIGRASGRERGCRYV